MLWFPLHFVTGLVFFCLHGIPANAQTCPPNIDFETGEFNNWTCYTGNTVGSNGMNQINLSATGPSPDRHTIYPANSGLMDPFGGFPVNCPNGSGYSIQLGNSSGGGEAEGISYEFTIPSNQNEYSLIYHYAVVFQDPHHQLFEQPRMEVEITNVSDNSIINCASFTFIPFGALPGFFESPIRGSDDSPVWCKDWSAVSINLDGLAGKTIRLFFKTADCVFRRHFGYAYIDVNSECSGEFVGASYCPDDTAVSVVAPYGYQNYTWFNSTFTQVLGTEQTIRFLPPPPPGTFIAVEVIPFAGYGCIDTLYAKLIDTLTVTAFAGPDILYCGDNPVPIGVIPRPGLVYSWSPAEGLSNSNVANPLASPSVTTTYVLSVRSRGGGCFNSDSVLVRSSSIDKSLVVTGKEKYCLGNNDSAVLTVKLADSIQWYRDGIVIRGANRTQYKVTQSGNYYATLFSNIGCIITTKSQPIVIDKPVPGIRYPDEFAIVELPYVLQARQIGNKVTWNPSVHLNDASGFRPLFTSSSDQLYTIRIETAAGCITVDTQLVKIVPYADILVPTAFTPNNDGRNDLLRPVLMGIKQLRYFRVYNRWGQLLFETKTSGKGWDGKLNGIQQTTGAVVWIAEGLGADGRIHARKGTSVLIR